MLATRWEPFAQMNRLRREMDRLFDRRGDEGQRGAFPPLNLWETPEELIVEAELPGFDLDQLEITVTEGNKLTIQGERKSPDLEGGSWHRRERGFGAFERLVELPSYVDIDHVSADLKHGVLTVRLPKRQEIKPRRIEVRAGE